MSIKVLQAIATIAIIFGSGGNVMADSCPSAKTPEVCAQQDPVRSAYLTCWNQGFMTAKCIWGSGKEKGKCVTVCFEHIGPKGK